MSNRYVLALDIGSNSVGSMWLDREAGTLTTGTSIFPAGVDESEEKRGDPKNAKRRMARRTRITLRRRAERKRALRLRLIAAGLLPDDAAGFKSVLETTDPWALRRDGLDNALTPHEFGRVLLHLAQRRGALGLKMPELEEGDDTESVGEDGKVKAAIGAVCAKMLAAKARTFGEFVAGVRDSRVHPLPGSDDRPLAARKGPRQYRDPIRNKLGRYEHCADRGMIRDEFRLLWAAQKRIGGPVAALLTDELRAELDDERGDSIWRHKGLLFGQRRQSWDLGTLGRCVLEPTERCAPHADMHASRYLVVETVNNLRIIEQGRPSRPLTPEERQKIKAYLSGPLGVSPARRVKGKVIAERPKQTATVTDLRELMGWGRATKTTRYRFNIESDEGRQINTDWFNREIVHGAIGVEAWLKMPPGLREGINRAILRHDPDADGDAEKLCGGVSDWAGLSHEQTAALASAWAKRPKIDAKRLNMSRRAVRNLLTVMDRSEPWPDAKSHGGYRWLTQIEARKLIAADAEFQDAVTGRPMDDKARRRYATGAKGSTARDRYYMGKHVLVKNGRPVIGPDGHPLAEPPPAPLISNPVVRKAIHEVRRHVVEYMMAFGRRPDEVYIELAREARLGGKDADRLLFRNRLRNRIRRDIVEHFDLSARTASQQRAAIDRVVLCVQQGRECPLCGKGGLTLLKAAKGEDCEVAHIVPKGSGGHNGLGNIVLAHTGCNRDMGRRTPRAFWDATLKGGFDEGFRWVEGIYGAVDRPKPAEVRRAEGDSLWACYFDRREDARKVEQFAKDIKDIQEMTQRQDAATKYASRQVMTYLSDALFDGKGLPERSAGAGDPESDRRIFATDGVWTGRLRREWALFFDPHGARAKGLGNTDEHERKEKNRGDHRHHAIDAVVIGLCTRSVQVAWENRERAADSAGVNTADEEQMEAYRRLHPLDPPAPFRSREEIHQAVKAAVYGGEDAEKPICHRPVKRKLVGALHKATQYGPVVDRWVQNGRVHEQLVEDRVTIRQRVLGEQSGDFLKPSHLRVPRQESESEAIERIARRLRIGKRALGDEEANREGKRIVRSSAFTPAMVEPKPEKGGIVRDSDLKRLLRKLLEERSLNPDRYTQSELKQSIQEKGPLRTSSGVPIHAVTLLWSNSEPVAIRRDTFDYATGARSKDLAPSSLRLYDGQNNHHIEVRAAMNKKGQEVWSGEIVSAFAAAQRKLAKLRALRAAGIPRPTEFRALPHAERRRLRTVLAAIEKAHPLVNRSDDDALGGRFVMSLCEGEMLWMQHKERPRELGYFVVAKLDKPSTVVLVPHWDARAAGERKDAENRPVPGSAREQFRATPGDLRSLAPAGHAHAVKVRISPLGVVTILERD